MSDKKKIFIDFFSIKKKLSFRNNSSWFVRYNTLSKQLAHGHDSCLALVKPYLPAQHYPTLSAWRERRQNCRVTRRHAAAATAVHANIPAGSTGSTVKPSAWSTSSYILHRRSPPHIPSLSALRPGQRCYSTLYPLRRNNDIQDLNSQQLYNGGSENRPGRVNKTIISIGLVGLESYSQIWNI